VLYPSDANQTAQLVAQMADLDGISYLRATREKTPVIYSPNEQFQVGGSKVLRQTDADAVTLIGAGVTLHEAVKAADALAADGLSARVIDLYSIKPIDGETLRAAAAATGHLITVEDHWPEGGLGEAVLDVFADSAERPRIVRLAVEHMPGSATPEQQLADAGIDASHIAAAARALVRERVMPAGVR
jgi:transketolase